MKKIIVASPGSTYTEGCVSSLLQTMAPHKGYTCLWINEKSSDIYTVRNAVMKSGIEAMPDYDYVLWVDSDMKWSWEDVEKLVQADVDIVSGVCLIGLQKSNAALFRELETEEGMKWALSYLNGWHLDRIPVNHTGLIEVDMVGFGFILFKRGVFEKIGEPYFRHAELEAPNGEKMITSEDMGFTYRCTQAGYQCHVHPDVKIVHQKRFDLEVHNAG